MSAWITVQKRRGREWTLCQKLIERTVGSHAILLLNIRQHFDTNLMTAALIFRLGSGDCGVRGRGILRKKCKASPVSADDAYPQRGRPWQGYWHCCAVPSCRPYKARCRQPPEYREPYWRKGKYQLIFDKENRDTQEAVGCIKICPAAFIWLR